MKRSWRDPYRKCDACKSEYDPSDKPNPTVHHAANVPQLMAENGLRLEP
jgi:hypothetical protein